MAQIESQAKSQTRISYPSMYSIVAYNDDVTPMDFVIDLLVDVFDKNLEEALALTLEIHKSEKRVVNTYTKELAEQKLFEANQYCRMNDKKLKIAMEKLS